MTTYKIHIFEIDKGSGKLYINFSTKGETECFAKFKKKVKKGNNPISLTKSLGTSEAFPKQKEAIIAIDELINELEKKGFEVIAGPPFQNKYYQIYVIELNNYPHTVYVGQTKYFPEIRLAQHQIGYNSASVVRRAESAKLRPDLFVHIEEAKTKEEALYLESEVAEYLKWKGYKVYGGH